MMNDGVIEYFKIKLADVKIEVECNYRLVFWQCRDYLASFQYPDFTVRTSMDEIKAERIEMPELIKNKQGIAIRHADEYIEPYIVYRKIAENMLAHNTILVHGSVIAYENRGYMFIAPSGTGKTTRTKIWMDLYPGTKVINGDKPLIKLTEHEVIAYGTPWCGKEGWNTNSMIPITTVFFLERADGDNESSIEEINIGEAFPILLQHTFRSSNPDNVRKTIRLLKGFENKVKFYRFHSKPTKDAVRLAYTTACNNK